MSYLFFMFVGEIEWYNDISLSNDAFSQEQRRFSVCLTKVIINWYGTPTTAVRLNGILSILSSTFIIKCTLRQGSALSPLFNIYVDDRISQLADINLGI